MNKIRVIKKSATGEAAGELKTVEENLPLKSKRRDAIETVENWVADWRKQTEIETRRAFDELTSFKLGNSVRIKPIPNAQRT